MSSLPSCYNHVTFVSPLLIPRPSLCHHSRNLNLSSKTRSTKSPTAFSHRRTRYLRMQSSPGTPPSGGGSPEPPDGKTLTQALELSFRNVWIRLMTTGVGKEYNDAIIAFVLSTMAAFKAGYSLNALKFELKANENLIASKATEEALAGRDVKLNEQEKQTRLIWITLVYLTMTKTKLVPERQMPSIKSELQGTPLEDMLSGLSSLVDGIFEAERKGYNLQTFKMEIAMQSGSGKPEQAQITQAQANIRSQWSRIVFSVLGLLPDTLKR